MGRPPCCDKIGVKKGPWTPEEDIILVSYIQEHGAGNWRAVPANTGLLRCSKSCRLRWTNYLRPGIRRGNFTEHEEKMIIHLQALLGNRWAAIASYLPQRTDNDIKNYWNTHLRKKLGKQQGHEEKGQNGNSSSDSKSVSKGQWERRLQTDIKMAKQALCEALSLDQSGPGPDSEALSGPKSIQEAAAATPYACSTENISRLLQNWMKKSPSSGSGSGSSMSNSIHNPSYGRSGSSPSPTFVSYNHPSNSDSVSVGDQAENLTPETDAVTHDESKPVLDTQMPFSLLEKWLLEDAGQGQDGDFMDLYNLENC